MRVACPSCQTTYKVNDERVAGKTVKIRCKRCQTVIVIDSSERNEVQRTGERNETSVLFSLSMLAPPTPAPPPTPAADPSSLIDLRALARPTSEVANMDSGGLYVPVLAAPPAEPIAPRHRLGWVPIAVGFALALAGVAAGVALHTPPTMAPALTAVPLSPPPSAAPPTVVATPQLPVEAPPPTPTVVASAPRVVSRVAASSSAVAAPPPSACCAGESDVACQVRRSVGASCESATPFDRAAAARALDSVALSACRSGASGQGHVVVTLQPSGAASNADVDAPPYAGTEQGRCIARAYRNVKVPAFSGAPVTVGKRFTL
jgi:predicted Zn finger-like uncharacterized protein